MANIADMSACPGTSTALTAVSLSSLVPATAQFVTYEGSLTQPGCQVGSVLYCTVY